jgi:hypothetical protein
MNRTSATCRLVWFTFVLATSVRLAFNVMGMIDTIWSFVVAAQLFKAAPTNAVNTIAAMYFFIGRVLLILGLF